MKGKTLAKVRKIDNKAVWNLLIKAIKLIIPLVTKPT
jgi:hypothetical protein